MAATRSGSRGACEGVVAACGLGIPLAETWLTDVRHVSFPQDKVNLENLLEMEEERSVVVLVKLFTCCAVV